MSVASGMVSGRGVASSGVVLMARVIGANGVKITQALLTSIAYMLTDLTARTSGSTRALTISSVVYDTYQTDAGWTEDSTGYNFRYTIPAADLAWTPAFDDVTETPIPHLFQADVKFVPTSGEPFVVPFQFWALPVWGG